MSKGNPNPKNSGQFQPGQSGNLSGRPQGHKSLTQTLREMMEAKEVKLVVTIDRPGQAPEINTYAIKTDQTIKYAISLAMVTQAIQGNVSAINSIFDRLDGRVETRDPKEKESEFKSLTNEEKRNKVIKLFRRVG